MLNEVNKLSMLRVLESGRYLSMSFHSWDLYEYSLLQSMTKHSWTVKTQLDHDSLSLLCRLKQNIMSTVKIYFDHCNLK